jgi:tRNA threonylcarbamoyladenosine biosynthesis protein TsaE
MSATDLVVTASAEETEALAAELADQLAAGTVIHVCGEIGCGKTTFIRGACRALGFNGAVTSPSYTVCNRYEQGDLLISHLDCQRLEGASGEEAGLLDDEVGPSRITFIEWPQQSEAAVGVIATIPASFRVELGHLSESQRTIRIIRGSV